MPPTDAVPFGSVGVPWGWLERWSPGGFVLGGAGKLLSFALLGPRLANPGPGQAWIGAVLLLRSLFLVFFVGLLGFYPQVAPLSPHLAIGGAVTAGIGGASITPSVVVSLVADASPSLPLVRTLVFDLSLPLAVLLDVLGVGGFGDQSRPFILFFFYPPSALLFVTSSSLLLSLLLSGLASVRTRNPLTVVGLLLMVPVVAAVGKIGLAMTDVELQTPALAGLPIILIVSLLAVGLLLRTRPGSVPFEQATLDDYLPGD